MCVARWNAHCNQPYPLLYCFLSYLNICIVWEIMSEKEDSSVKWVYWTKGRKRNWDFDWRHRFKNKTNIHLCIVRKILLIIYIIREKRNAAINLFLKFQKNRIFIEKTNVCEIFIYSRAVYYTSEKHYGSFKQIIIEKDRW